MMNISIRTILAAVLAAALAAPFAAAQDSLDLATARELVLANSASLRKAALAYDSAALAERAQAYKLLPSVSASAGGSLDYLGDGTLADRLGATLKVSASQTVYDGGKQAALVKSGGVAVEAAAEAVRAARVSAVGQADAAFYAALKAAATVDAAAADLDAARLRLSIAKAKAEAGVIAESDYLQAEAEAAGNETSLNKAKKALASARAKLASLTGLPASTALVPVDFSRYDGLLLKLVALDGDDADRLAGAYTVMAAEANPALAGYALAARKATIAVDVAESAYAPSVSAGLSQGLGWGAADGFSVGAGSLTLSGSISLDLWTTANGVASARVAADSAALDAAEGARSLALDIDVAVNGLLSAAGSIASSAKALEYAESSYRNVLEKFTLSSASASDLSAAEALVSADRTGLISARYDFLSAISELRALVGLEGEERIIDAVR